MSKKYPVKKEEFETLEQMGYTITPLSLYQFRIARDGEDFIDIFPITRRYCLKRDGFFSKGKGYANLIETVENELDTFAQSLRK